MSGTEAEITGERIPGEDRDRIMRGHRAASVFDTQSAQGSGNLDIRVATQRAESMIAAIPPFRGRRNNGSKGEVVSSMTRHKITSK